MDVAAERAYMTPLSNSTLLPLLLLSLAKQKHTPEPAKTIMSEYDYVIVGAGSAGSVVASRLTELPCVRVLLLEAGGPPPLISDVPGVGRFLRGSDIDWNYKTVPQKYTGNGLVNRQVVWNSGKTIGGSSVLNAMLYVRGNKKNYDRWAREGAKGWSYHDVLPYFKKMEDNRDWEYVVNGYHGKHGPQTVQRPRYQSEIKDPIFKTVKAMGYQIVDPNAARQTGFYDFQATLRGGQRCSTAKAYLVPAENRTNLDILPNAMVRKVIIKNHQAVGVRFDFHGKTYTVKAKKEVILSAGTVNTAKLLLLSGIGPKGQLEHFKIPVHADLPVGKNLQDHIGAFTNFQVKHLPRGSEKLAMPLNINQYIHNRTGPLTTADFDSALAFLKNRAIVPKKDFPDHQLYFAEAQADLFAPLGLKPQVIEQVYGPYQRYGFMVCISQILHPRSRGTVTLKSKNPYHYPAINPNYLEDPHDIKDIVEGMKACMRISTHPIMKEAGIVPFHTLYPGCEKYAGNLDKYFTCVTKSVVASFSNYVGTARMGDPKDHRTVVDPHLRVLNIKNLRVVDASVMPIIPSGNTNIPTIMIAEKASDIIKSTIHCEHEDHEEWSETDDPSTSDEPHNYPLDPDSDSDEKHKDEWTETEDSEWSDDKPHNYPLDPDSNTDEKHEESWDDKEESGWSDEDEPHHESNHEDSHSVHDTSDVKEVLKDESSWVVPWNKEIPNVIPWNQEIMQSNGLGLNLPLNTSLANLGLPTIANNPVLPNAPTPTAPQAPAGIPGIAGAAASALPNAPTPNAPQVPAGIPGIAGAAASVLPNAPTPNAPQAPAGIPGIAGAAASALPNAPQAPSGIPGIAGAAASVLPNAPVQGTPNPPQAQAGLPGIPTNPALPAAQSQVPLVPSGSPEIKSYLEPQTSHYHGNSHSGHLHGHHGVIPWNKEIPNVVPWNRELAQAPVKVTADNVNAAISNPGVQNVANNPALPTAEVQQALNPVLTQLPVNPPQPQQPSSAQLPQTPVVPAQLPPNSIQSLAPAVPSLPQISQSQAPASPPQLPNVINPLQPNTGALQSLAPAVPSLPQISQSQAPASLPQLPNVINALQPNIGAFQPLGKVGQMKLKLIQLLQQLLNSNNAANAAANSAINTVANAAGNTVANAAANTVANAAGNTVGNAAGNTAANTVGNAAPNTVGNAAGNTVANAAGNTVANAAANTIGNAVANGVGNAAPNTVGNAAGNTVANAAANTVGNAAGNTVPNAAGNTVGNTVGNAAANTVGNAVGNTVPNAAGNTVASAPANTVANAAANVLPMIPAVTTNQQGVQKYTPCDKSFCDALINFMRCQEVSCQRRRQFSAYMYQAMCS